MAPLNSESSRPWTFSFKEVQTKLDYGLPWIQKKDEERTTRTKSVRFNSQEERYEIPNLDSFTAGEISDSWYSRFDFSTFSREVSKTIYLIKNYPHLVDDIEYTSRGTESRMEKLCNQRRQNIFHARQFVLNSQKENKKKDWIGLVYGQISQATIQAAIIRASHDATTNNNNNARYEPNFTKDNHFNSNAFSSTWITPVPACRVTPFEPQIQKSVLFVDNPSSFCEMWIRGAVFA